MFDSILPIGRMFSELTLALTHSFFPLSLHNAAPTQALAPGELASTGAVRRAT
jgi:hypothetical protein